MRAGCAPALVVATPGGGTGGRGRVRRGPAAGRQPDARPPVAARRGADLCRRLNAAALVRRQSTAAQWWLTVDQDRAVSALVRQPRRALGAGAARAPTAACPPRGAHRGAHGSPRALAATLRDLQLPERVRVVGPAPGREHTRQWR
ncbi:hypothetical protein QJS66_03830 [Kocuria rhizophila]|nr:hypothetical protein QJS66_03830 [Kocuria rhizophila]